jgi:hypothetical protein
MGSGLKGSINISSWPLFASSKEAAEMSAAVAMKHEPWAFKAYVTIHCHSDAYKSIYLSRATGFYGPESVK